MKVLSGLVGFIQMLLNDLFKFIRESIFLIVIMIAIAIYLYLEENPRQIQVTKFEQIEIDISINKLQAFLELYTNVDLERKDYRNELWKNLEMTIHIRNNLLNNRNNFWKTWRLKSETRSRDKIVQKLEAEYGVDIEPILISSLKYYNNN